MNENTKYAPLTRWFIWSRWSLVIDWLHGPGTSIMDRGIYRSTRTLTLFTWTCATKTINSLKKAHIGMQHYMPSLEGSDALYLFKQWESLMFVIFTFIHVADVFFPWYPDILTTVLKNTTRQTTYQLPKPGSPSLPTRNHYQTLHHRKVIFKDKTTVSQSGNLKCS